MGNRRIVRGRSREKKEREKISEQLGDSPRVLWRQKIKDLDVEEIEREIERTEKALDDNLRRRAERVGVVVEQDAFPEKRKRLTGSKLPWMLLLLSITRTDIFDSGNQNCLRLVNAGRQEHMVMLSLAAAQFRQ